MGPRELVAAFLGMVGNPAENKTIMGEERRSQFGLQIPLKYLCRIIARVGTHPDTGSNSAAKPSRPPALSPFRGVSGTGDPTCDVCVQISPSRANTCGLLALTSSFSVFKVF